MLTLPSIVSSSKSFVFLLLFVMVVIPDKPAISEGSQMDLLLDVKSETDVLAFR